MLSSQDLAKKFEGLFEIIHEGINKLNESKINVFVHKNYLIQKETKWSLKTN